MYDFFVRDEIENKEVSEHFFPGLAEKLDVPLGFLFFQLTTMFTYYHEHGHILQFSGGTTEKKIEEKKFISGENFDRTDHAMEIDADIHAAHLITFHILQYWKKLQNRDQTKENLENLLAITAVGIFIFYFLLNDGISKIYFMESSHPHEVIRISYIVDALVGIAQQNLGGSEKLNIKTILQNAFFLTDELLIVQLGISISEFIVAFREGSANIHNYLREMLTYMHELNFLVRNHENPYQ